MRLFLSVDVPEPDLAPHRGSDHAPGHLTVLFLGEVDERKVDELSRGFTAALGGVPSFEVQLRGVGVFPNERSPRILWVGVDEGAEALGRLHDRLADAARAAGLTVESRPFVPHLTVRRLRGPREISDARDLLVGHRDERFGRGEVTAVDLKSSRLEPGGAVHETLASFPLLRGGRPPRGP